MYGTRLKMLRQSLGLSQQEFAEAIGLSQTTYSGYERERSQPPFDILKKICSIYDVDVNWLLDMKGTDYRELLDGRYNDFADLVSMGFSTDEAYRMERDQFNRYGDMIMKLDYNDRKRVTDFIEQIMKEHEE